MALCFLLRRSYIVMIDIHLTHNILIVRYIFFLNKISNSILILFFLLNLYVVIY